MINEFELALSKALVQLLKDLTEDFMDYRDDNQPKRTIIVQGPVYFRKRPSKEDEIVVRIRNHRIRRRRYDNGNPNRFSLLVDTIDNIRIVVWPNDHDCHFHAICRGKFDVRIDIESCKVTSVKSGKIYQKEAKTLENWARQHQDLLRKAWESTRPTDFEAGFANPRRVKRSIKKY